MEKIKHKPYGPYEKYIKRPLDLICSLIAIIVFSWLYLIIAILVRVKLGSPVIFTQDRPGKDEKIFKLYKFRTMTDEKDESGKLIYLYTDNACTYQFYEHRGFERSEERQVVLDLDKRQVPLTCLFYTNLNP